MHTGPSSVVDALRVVGDLTTTGFPCFNFFGIGEEHLKQVHLTLQLKSHMIMPQMDDIRERNHEIRVRI